MIENSRGLSPYFDNDPDANKTVRIYSNLLKCLGLG